MKKKLIYLLLCSLTLAPLATLAEEGSETSASSSDTAISSSSEDSSTSPSSEETQPSSSQETEKKEDKKDEKDKDKKEEEKKVESKKEKEEEAGLKEEKKDDDEVDFTVSVNYTTQQFIKKIGEDARGLGKEHDLYASVMIAQAILESGSGNSGLAQPPHHNLFGIKGSYKGSSVKMSTQEDDGTGKLYTIQDHFRSYPNYKASLEDYADLLTQPIYAASKKSNAASYQEATKALTGLYATDKYYDQKLNALIEAYHLTKYDQDRKKSLLEEHPDGDFPDYDGKDYPGSEAYSDISARYSYNRISQLGGHLESNFGLPKEWGQRAVEAGYTLNQEAKAGKVVILEPGKEKAGKNGQVAVVEKVYASGAILISEYEKISKKLVSYRVIDAGVAKKLTYIEAKIVPAQEDEE